MRRFIGFSLALASVILAVPTSAQQVPPRATAFATAPDIPYESVPNFLTMPPNLYLGEGIGIARNSKGHIFVFTRSGDTRLFEFDQNGKFVREIGQGLANPDSDVLDRPRRGVVERDLMELSNRSRHARHHAGLVSALKRLHQRVSPQPLEGQQSSTGVGAHHARNCE